MNADRNANRYAERMQTAMPNPLLRTEDRGQRTSNALNSLRSFCLVGYQLPPSLRSVAIEDPLPQLTRWSAATRVRLPTTDRARARRQPKPSTPMTTSDPLEHDPACGRRSPRKLPNGRRGYCRRQPGHDGKHLDRRIIRVTPPGQLDGIAYWSDNTR